MSPTSSVLVSYTSQQATPSLLTTTGKSKRAVPFHAWDMRMCVCMWMCVRVYVFVSGWGWECGGVGGWGGGGGDSNCSQHMHMQRTACAGASNSHFSGSISYLLLGQNIPMISLACQ